MCVCVCACVWVCVGWVEQVSTIPKGGTASTWTYPSPQMFYNALVRKDKAQDVTPQDMESVVSVHNGARANLSPSPPVAPMLATAHKCGLCIRLRS